MNVLCVCVRSSVAWLALGRRLLLGRRPVGTSCSVTVSYSVGARLAPRARPAPAVGAHCAVAPPALLLGLRLLGRSSQVQLGRCSLGTSCLGARCEIVARCSARAGCAVRPCCAVHSRYAVRVWCGPRTVRSLGPCTLCSVLRAPCSAHARCSVARAARSARCSACAECSFRVRCARSALTVFGPRARGAFGPRPGRVLACLTYALLCTQNS